MVRLLLYPAWIDDRIFALLSNGNGSYLIWVLINNYLIALSSLETRLPGLY